MKQEKTSFGQALRIARIMKNLSAANLAEKLGCSKSLVYLMENDVRAPSPSMAQQMEEILGASLPPTPRSAEPTTKALKIDSEEGLSFVHPNHGIGEVVAILESSTGVEFIMVFRKYCICKETEVKPCTRSEIQSISPTAENPIRE
jgi:transcriptional regulator with XRE-family HTH domain